MAERKPFLLRIDADLYAALARWADDELRSLNGQIEFLLRRALVGAGRMKQAGAGADAAPPAGSRSPAAAPPAAARKPSADWDVMED